MISRITALLIRANRPDARHICRVGLLVSILIWPSAIFAQSPSIDRNAQRAQVNAGAVMIAADHPDSSLMKIADDMATVLNGADENFRVVPVVGDGAAGNIRDVILLRNIDLGLTDLTALERLRQSRDLSQMLQRELAHVVTLFPDKIAIIARKTVKDIQALKGRPVSIGVKDSGSALHAESIFKSFGVEVKPVYLPPIDSAEALLSGSIDAFACFCLSSPGVYQRLMFNIDVHLLPVPFESSLQRDYLPASLSHEEFPAFISKGKTVDTIAVTLALVTYNWDRNNPRYVRVAKFVERLFNNLPKLQEAPRHKGWRSVQISATAQGWPRFAAAAEWQAAQRSEAIQDMRVAFNEFLSRWTSEAAAVNQSDQIKLFEEFLQWRETAR